MRGNVVMAENITPKEPTRDDGAEQVYRADFDEGLSKPGKYQAHVTAFLRWSESGKRGWPEMESEPIPIEVTK